MNFDKLRRLSVPKITNTAVITKEKVELPIWSDMFRLVEAGEICIASIFCTSLSLPLS